MQRQTFLNAILVLALLVPTAFGQEAKKEEAQPATGGKIKIMLLKNMELEGSPVDLEEIKMNSIFGEASIPLHTIAGIRFAQQPSEQSTVVLLNGDALTGEIALSDVKCVAEWGEAKVNVTHIVSIVFRPDLAWSSVSTPNGPRWQLKKSSMSSTPTQQFGR